MTDEKLLCPVCAPHQVGPGYEDRLELYAHLMTDTHHKDELAKYIARNFMKFPREREL